MAIDATIQEGGASRNFSPVNKLEINLQGGGKSLWVPAEEVELEDLDTDENGEFHAAEHGVYGWDEIVVDVDTSIDSPDDDDDTDYEEPDEPWEDEDDPDENPYYDEDGVWGIDPETGEEVVITVDDDGNLKSEELPDHIEIFSLPYHEQIALRYNDGDPIDAVGLCCTIHNADGSLWENEHYPQSRLEYSADAVHTPGTVVGELSIDPTVASASGGSGGGGAVIPDPTGLDWRWIDAMPIRYYTQDRLSTLRFDEYNPNDSSTGYWGGGNNGEPQFEIISSSSPVVFCVFRYPNDSFVAGVVNYVVAFSKSNFTIRETRHNKSGVYTRTKTTEGGQVNGNPVYRAVLEQESITNWVSTVNMEAQTLDFFPYQSQFDPGYIVLYGNTSSLGDQVITVTWPRYGDKKPLTTTFDVLVFTGQGG